MITTSSAHVGVPRLLSKATREGQVQKTDAGK